MREQKLFLILLIISALALVGCGGGAPSPGKPDISAPQISGPQAGGANIQPGGGGGLSGPGAAGGVSLGGPGGGGASGPSAVGGAPGMSQAGFGGKGGFGGSATLTASAGPSLSPPGGGLAGGSGPAGGINRPGGGPAGGGLGSGGNNGPGAAGGQGVSALFGAGEPGVRFQTRPDGLSGLGNLSGVLPAGFAFGENGQFQIPQTTTLLDDLDTAASASAIAQEAAEQAQTTAGEALEQGQETGQEAGQEAIEQAQETAHHAQQAAQDAYEQLWDDYYEAVDYAAQAYYDTVTAAIDYGAETFEEYYNQAVTAAYDVVDYYYSYYYDWAAYCALYPWDCYQYSYDEASGAYVTEETINNYYYSYYYGESGETTSASGGQAVPVSQAVPAQPVQAPAVQPPAPSQEAYEAIVIFANDQLGAAVEPVYAGELSAEVLALMQMLPAYAQYTGYEALNISAEAYYALIQGGVAAVAVGECPQGSTCQLSGDLPAEISEASLGSYAIQTAETMPAAAGDALQLLTLVYPRLTGLDFTQVQADTATLPGYAFTATTTSAALIDGQPGFVTKVVFGGVVTVDGRTVVYAVVGLGESFATLANPLG